MKSERPSSISSKNISSDLPARHFSCPFDQAAEFLLRDAVMSVQFRVGRIEALVFDREALEYDNPEKIFTLFPELVLEQLHCDETSTD